MRSNNTPANSEEQKVKNTTRITRQFKKSWLCATFSILTPSDARLRCSSAQPNPAFYRAQSRYAIALAQLTLGVATARAQHAFAGPTNKFWPLLYSSGITTLRHTFEIDKSLPKLYNVGITNLIPRPTRCASELSKAEMLENVDIVEEKVRTYRPKAVCVVGKGIWDAFHERKHSGKKVGKDFKFGWQPELIGASDEWNGARCFVTPSTSGRVAAYSREFQEALWKELGNWVKLERGDINKDGLNGMKEHIEDKEKSNHQKAIKKEPDT